MRTFKLAEGEPLDTSFGQDLYRKIWMAEASDGDTGGGRDGEPSGSARPEP